MASLDRQGRITTFYSYKGGVGRTMALANLAYVAAWNGKRVLVMDWDLEAPGLAYYFRGLTEDSLAAIADAPGILNIVWEWRTLLREVDDAEVLEQAIARFAEGIPFALCARSIIEAQFLPESAPTIDFIGCGSASVATPKQTDYADALARFSWNEFIGDEGGGVVIEGLRKWAKSTYDVILIDSRTGYADVAGLCTMQLPDEVALCFVLNRQNIEGIAGVAGAIRSVRGDSVELRAIPMRTARQNTSEESDARAKAIGDLSKIGGFQRAAISRDLDLLGIAATENVPFYETLAPLAAVDAASDLLVSHYKRMAAGLLGGDLQSPLPSPEALAVFRRRMRQKRVTLEHLQGLTSGDPDRARSELTRLVQSAQQTFAEGEAEDADYVEALVEAVFVLEPGDDEGGESANSLRDAAVDLVRRNYEINSERWRGLLALLIERQINEETLDSLDRELKLLEELEALSDDSSAIDQQLRRIAHRRRAAWLNFFRGDFQSASEIRDHVGRLVKTAERPADEIEIDQKVELVWTRADMNMLRGRLLQSGEHHSRAEAAFNEAIADAGSVPDSPRWSRTLQRLKSDAHSRLAMLGEQEATARKREERALHAVEAVRGGLSDARIRARFSELAEVVIRAGQPALVRAFCDVAFQERRPSQTNYLIPRIYAGKTRPAAQLLETMALLVDALTDISEPPLVADPTIARIATSGASVITAVSRLAAKNDSGDPAAFVRSVFLLIHALSRRAPAELVEDLHSRLQFFEDRAAGIDDPEGFFPE